MVTQPLCLLVEDQALIALALEASLEESGFQVAATVNSVATALDWLQHHEPDLVLLDVMLKDGPALPVARALKARGIPFAIYSGLPPEPHAAEFRDAPWLEKPVSRAQLTDVLVGLARGLVEMPSFPRLANA